MRVIDLLNKIVKGEEVPRKFTYNGYLWEYDVKNKMWFYYFGEGKSHRFDRLFYINQILNDEIEILEEVEDKEYEDIEELSYAGYTSNTHEVDKELYYIRTINALIRNQNKIIERMKRDE